MRNDPRAATLNALSGTYETVLASNATAEPKFSKRLSACVYIMKKGITGLRFIVTVSCDGKKENEYGKVFSSIRKATSYYDSVHPQKIQRLNP